MGIDAQAERSSLSSKRNMSCLSLPPLGVTSRYMRSCKPLAEGIAALKTKPVLHGDNGATLKATTVLAMLNWLGVKPSYSRPRVSDDNAFSESLFRTAKYRPEFPPKGFEQLDDARTWAVGFVHWYNVDRHHSGIRYVSPNERHVGRDVAILAARHALYLKARERNPARWSGNTRNWSHIGIVTLNPERNSVVTAHLRSIDTQPLAAWPRRQPP
jgi:putative transposase